MPANSDPCTGTPTPSGSVDYNHVTSCSGSSPACSFECEPGHGFSGGQCLEYSCANSPPSRGTACSGTPSPSNGTTNYSNVSSCSGSSAACTFDCDSGYHWNGANACVANVCSSSTPSGATACAAQPSLIPNNNQANVVRGNGSSTCSSTVACDYYCPSGKEQSGNSCVDSGPTITCTTVPYEFDGWVGSGPMCNRFNWHNYFCNGFNDCTARNAILTINSHAVCNMTIEVCHSGRTGGTGSSSPGSRCSYDQCAIECEEWDIDPTVGVKELSLIHI